MRRSRLIFSVLVALVGATLASDIPAPVKRAPLGFQGVRGKKSIDDTYAELDDGAAPPLDTEKRAPMPGFQGVRGKKMYESPMSVLMPLPKRAPMGFLGMRGKKEMEVVNEEFDKRAPNMGFLGMRGKKEFEDEAEAAAYNDYYSDNGHDGYMDKRAPMGFLGMRGKKEYSPFLEEDKRAPAAQGFFGMRGKKQPGRQSFFGMRGKKYPYEFRGKFVGVRGKKGSAEDAIPGEEYASNLALDDLMMLLAEGGNDGPAWQKRKAPSGFLGMRG